MESNITEQQYFAGDLQLAEPHFDEEATVAAARQVVPLNRINQIKAQARSGRRVAFGLSILVSLMVGALAATLIYQQRGQEPATANVDTAVIGSGTAAQESAVNAPSAGEAGEDVSTAEVRDVEVPAADKKPAPRLARSVNSAGAKSRQAKPIYQVDEREMRRADRVEARSLRRRAKREEQKEARRKSRSSDDLLRIREIFEGSRRP